MSHKPISFVAAVLGMVAGVAQATPPVARFEYPDTGTETCGATFSVQASGFVISTASDAYPGSAHRYQKIGDSWTDIGPFRLDTGADFASCNSRFVESGSQLIASQPFVGVYQGGTVSVLSAAGNAWHVDQVLLPDGPGAFGTAIAVDGDWLAVGSPGSDSGFGTEGTGAVYVYHRDNGIWTRSDRLLSPDYYSHARFGATLVFANGTLVIGEPNDPLFHNNGVGRAFVYAISGGHWTYLHELPKGPHGAPFESDSFGTRLAFNGQHLLATSLTDYNGTLNAYAWNGSAWEPAFDVTGDQLGAFVLINLATIGNDVLVAGSRGYPEHRLFVLHDLGGSFSVATELTAPSNAASLGYFGSQTAVAGSSLLVSASFECTTATACPGAAYLYDVAQVTVLFAGDFE